MSVRFKEDLGDAVLLDVPADALDRLQGARDADRLALRIENGRTRNAVALFDSACLADVKRDGVRPAARRGVQVDVVGRKSRAPTAVAPVRRAASLNSAGPKSGAPSSVPELAEAFVLAFAAHGEVLALGALRRRFVE